MTAPPTTQLEADQAPAPPTTQLEADQAFATALCEFQKQAADHGTTAALLGSAHEFGFSWFTRPATAALGTQVVLRHVGGSAFDAIGDNPTLLLLGLLGELSGIYPVTLDPAPQPAEPKHAGPGIVVGLNNSGGRIASGTPVCATGTSGTTITVAPTAELEQKSAPSHGAAALQVIAEAQAKVAAQPEPPAAQAAAESLAAATGGTVFELAEGDPALTPLTDAEKATAKQMVRELTEAQRKAFASAFRNAFAVDKEEKSIIPLITELRHAKFVNRFSIEANGGVAP